MRHLSTLISPRSSDVRAPLFNQRRHDDAKSAPEPKPRPKRSLNEAAHKLHR